MKLNLAHTWSTGPMIFLVKLRRASHWQSAVAKVINLTQSIFAFASRVIDRNRYGPHLYSFRLPSKRILEPILAAESSHHRGESDIGE
jgi:hypothetical protein